MPTDSIIKYYLSMLIFEKKNLASFFKKKQVLSECFNLIIDEFLSDRCNTRYYLPM